MSSSRPRTTRQPVLSEFFSVRKRPPDQHPAKKRKIELDSSSLKAKWRDEPGDKAVPQTNVEQPSNEREDGKSIVCSREVLALKDNSAPSSEELSAVTSAVDSHNSLGISASKTTPAPSTKTAPATPSLRKGRKRTSLENALSSTTPVSDDQKLLFSVGASDPSVRSAKKRLDLDSFQKKRNVAFEKKGLLSPSKDSTKRVDSTKPTADEIKRQLGRVSKLSDLQARLRKIESLKVPHPAKTTGCSIPRLSKAPVDLVITSPIKQTPMKSPYKASPKKQLAFSHKVVLPQPTEHTPLPRSYRQLADFFRQMDGLVAMMFNRGQIVTVKKLCESVQQSTKKTFGDKQLRQIRCVFPLAYNYKWEPLIDRFGTKKEDYDLRIKPILNSNAPEEEQPKGEKLTPAKMAERKLYFTATLLNMVKDHHSQFLLNLDNSVTLTRDVTAWMNGFDPETCPDVDESPLPEKPNVEKVTGAADMIKATRALFKNERLEEALKDQAERELKRQEEAVAKTAQVKPENDTASSAKSKESFKGMEALMERIRAKERAKRIREMTQDNQERKDQKQREELLELGPMIINCYRCECQNQKRKALVAKEFFSFVAYSSKGAKSTREMENLIRLFVDVVPGGLKFLKLAGTEYIKQAASELPTVPAIKRELLKGSKKE